MVEIKDNTINHLINFSPNEGWESIKKIVKYLWHAKHSIYIMSSSLTEQSIVDMIIKKHKAGVLIRILTDF